MVIVDKNNLTDYVGKYVFLDNDFLGTIFRYPELLEEILDLFVYNYLFIDTLVEFEFLRDVFLPDSIKWKEDFVTREVFAPTIMHHEVFGKLRENALILSKVYAHQGQNKQHKSNSPSLVDLFLAARLMLYTDKSILVTGNKKDFPNYIFDIKTVINFEEPNGSLRSFSVLEFNKEKFKQCYEKLDKLS